MVNTEARTPSRRRRGVYYTQTPDLLFDCDAYKSIDLKVYRVITRDARKHDWETDLKSPFIAAKLQKSPETVIRSLGRLTKIIPPGYDHPVLEVEGFTSARKIRVLIYPKEAAVPILPASVTNDASWRPASVIRDASHSTQPLAAKGRPSQALLFEPIQDKLNVNVASLSGENLTHAHARESSGPIPALTPTAPHAFEPPPMQAAEVASPAARAEAAPASAKVEKQDGVPPDLAGKTADQVRERIAELEVEEKALERTSRGESKIMNRLRLQIARGFLKDLTTQAGPVLTPVVPPQRPAATTPPPPKPTIQALVNALVRPGGPAEVEAYAQFVASKLNDANSLDFHRKIGRRIQAGEIPPGRALKAYRQSQSGTGNKPAAIYNAAIRRLE